MKKMKKMMKMMKKMKMKKMKMMKMMMKTVSEYVLNGQARNGNGGKISQASLGIQGPGEPAKQLHNHTLTVSHFPTPSRGFTNHFAFISPLCPRIHDYE